MKAYYLRAAAALLAVCASLSALAVTEEWSYGDDLGAVYQIIADGSGGCALYGVTTNGAAIVAWLDKAGAVVYTKSLSNSFYGIAAFSKKELIYSSAGVAPPYTFVRVDKNGAETTVSDAGYNLVTSLLGPIALVQVTADNKGFFSIKLPLTPGPVKLARFSYK